MNKIVAVLVAVVLLTLASVYFFVEQDTVPGSTGQGLLLAGKDKTQKKRRSKPKGGEISEVAVLGLINDARSEIERPALRLHPTLVQVAASRAFDMKDREYFSEVSPLGESVRTVASQAGYRHLHLAEYRLKGKFSNLSELAEKLLDLENPETQLLLAGYTDTGIGIEMASDDSGELYLVQVLAVPFAACSAVNPVLIVELEKNRDLLEQLGVSVEEAIDEEIEPESSPAPDVAELIAVTRLLNENLSEAEDVYENCIREYLELVTATPGADSESIAAEQ